MAKDQKDKVSDKKTNREKIEKQLSTAVAGLKPVLGEQLFKKRIQKAGKLLTKGVKKSGSGKTDEKKTAAKKIKEPKHKSGK